MPRTLDATDPDSAISTALLAERDLQDAIETCRREAEALIVAAQARAAGIHERAEARITRTHVRCTRAVSRAIDHLVVEQHGTLATSSRRIALSDAVIARVAARVAAELTGAGAAAAEEEPAP